MGSSILTIILFLVLPKRRVVHVDNVLTIPAGAGESIYAREGQP